MFIGQGLSLEARRAAKAERRAAINATAAPSTVAAVVAERALSASPPLLLLALSPPAGILTPAAERTADLLGLSTGAAGLSTAAPSAAVATVTAAAPRLWRLAHLWPRLAVVRHSLKIRC